MIAATSPLQDLVNDAAVALQNPLFALGKHNIATADVLKYVLLIVGLSILARLTRRRIVTRLMAHTQTDEGTRYAIARLAGYCVWVVGVFVGLPLLGFELQNMVVAVGALGIGLGLGLQRLTENFVSGLVLLFGRPVKVGDRIQVGEIVGAVVAIHARATMIRTNDNEIVMVPNGDLVSNSVTNLTHNDRKIRYSIPVGVSYHADPEQVKDALLAVAADCTSTLSEPAPDVIFEGFGDSALNFKLRVFTSRMLTVPDKLTSELNFAIWYKLKEMGIEIPFPQRDLHIRSVAPEAAARLAS
jgi:small-conductance mechanosensitive channel